MPRSLHFFLGALVWCLLSSGCASRLTKMAAGPLIDNVSAAAAKHDDVDLVKEGIPSFLLIVDGLLEGRPNDRDLLLSASEAYTSYAALVEIDDPKRAAKLYHRAKAYGASALGQNKKIAPLLDAPYSEFLPIVEHLNRKDLPAVFWAASAWGAWISHSTDSMEALAQLPKVILLMEWVVNQDESFFFGSPHIFLGVYHAALPPMLGGKPDKSKHHFERALALSKGQVLMNYCQMARFYARQVFDRDLYVELLQKALDAPADQVPELTLQNVAAKRLARQLLEETDDFF